MADNPYVSGDDLTAYEVEAGRVSRLLNGLSIEGFAEKYMEGRRPLSAQGEAIGRFLWAMEAELWHQGAGAGKSVVRNALIRFLDDCERTDKGEPGYWRYVIEEGWSG